MSQLHHYALVGFANSGKSTLFNLVSGDKQKVGNWSGVTVAVKRKNITLPSHEAVLSDLPGLHSLSQQKEQGQDLTISHAFLQQQKIDCLINVVDATQLKRQLFLTSQLLELGVPMLVVLNKTDRKEAVKVDIDTLTEQLGCPVIAICAQDKVCISKVHQELESLKVRQASQRPLEPVADKAQASAIESIQARHQWIHGAVEKSLIPSSASNGFSDRLDNFILHPIAGVPVFLGMMYLLFMFAINVGGAFIDFFDILSGSLFVEYPMHYLSGLGLPMWLLTIVEGIGSGMQTVATFVPIIACLFIGLSLLESTGYLARAAFVIDSLMQKIGLPGKAFVPLIVGFGCTVPAVMSARVLDSERERITTVMMAPFMSCGARLPVYALFAAAFFPENGQNLVFLLYLIGIAAAIFTGFLLKKTTLPGNSSLNIMELPLYEMPKLGDISQRVYQRTKGFVTGAGKTIVTVVCLLNFFNSIDSQGNFGNQDSESSLLSQGAQIVMPVLAPLGVKEENWQAGVGIITGIFAKEVLVATFNSLYSPGQEDDAGAPSLQDSWDEALATIKENLLGIKPDDPLSMDVGEISDLEIAAQEQEVEITTYHVMQNAFAGQLGAFSYLLFILLYTPCVAAMGAIKNEVGSRWAGFAAIWSFVFAYLVATFCYQLGTIFQTPLTSMFAILMVILAFVLVYLWLKHKGSRVLSIPVAVKYS